MRQHRTLLIVQIDMRTTAIAEALTTVVTIPPGKGHSKRSKLYYDMSKRVCWKYISYCKGNQDIVQLLFQVYHLAQKHLKTQMFLLFE